MDLPIWTSAKIDFETLFPDLKNAKEFYAFRIAPVSREAQAAITDCEMRLKDSPVAADILGQLADGYHWKGMDKEAVDKLARHLSARGDLPRSAAIRRAFETGGYAGVVYSQLTTLEKRA